MRVYSIGLALIASLLLFSGCTGGTGDVEAAKECVNTYLTALKEKDFDTAYTCMLPNGTADVFEPSAYQDPLSQAIISNLDYTIGSAACSDGRAQVQVHISNVDVRSAYHDSMDAVKQAELSNGYAQEIREGLTTRIAEEDAPRLNDDVMILLEYRDGTWYISPDKKLDNLILGGLPTVLAEGEEADSEDET